MTDRTNDPLATLLDAALVAAERGDDRVAAELAAEILRRDPRNEAARGILAGTGVETPGESRRITILFCDLVGSTRMSSRHEPDVYRRVLQRYHRLCDEVITQHGGHVQRRTGDGVLALFGHPLSHEEDTRRAVRAGLALASRVLGASPEVRHEFGEALEVRIAIHLGPVHIDLLDDEIYGLAPNVAARLQDLAAPGTVVASDEVLDVVGGFFESRAHVARSVKGVDAPVGYHTVERELPQTPERGRSWHTRFVGRHDVKARLGRALAEGVSSRPSAVVVRGEPGIGKSRLVAEVLGAVVTPPRTTMTILCTEYEQSNDLGAAGGILRLDPALAATQRPVERLHQLVGDLRSLGLDPDHHTPLLAPLLGLDPSIGYARAATDLTRLHDQVLGSLRAWLAALGARAPMVLLVEDVHWADPSTCELLLGLVSDPIEGVHLLATERTGAEQLVGRDLLVIQVEPLDAEESAELARTIDTEIDAERLATALRRGQGNPLFLEELAQVSQARAPVDPELLSRLMAESVVPSALYEPLLARIYSSGADIGLAQAAATIGRGFSRDVLAAVVPRQPEALDQGIRSLLDAGLLDAEEEGVYWFRHALIRDLAYDLQPREQRATMHRRVGDALRARREEGAAVSWAVIATHYHAAGRVDDAIDGYEAAADDARERGSMVAGNEHLTSAIELLISQDRSDGAARLSEIDLRLKRGFLCVSTGGNADPRAVDDYERCLALIRSEENGPEFVGTLVALWGYYTARGDLARADGLLDDIVATGITDDPVMLAENRTARGMVRFFQGDFAAAERELSLAMEGFADAAPYTHEPSQWQFPNDPVATMHVQYGLARWQLGDLSGFRDHIRRAEHRAERLPVPDGPFNVAFSLTYQAWVLTEVGQLDHAATRADALLQIAVQYGFAFWELAATTADAINRARIELSADAPDHALLGEQAARLGGTAVMTQMIDSRLLLPYGLTAQGSITAELGRLDEALELFDQALLVADETGSQFYSAETHRLRARSLRSVDEKRADAELRRAAELARLQGSVPFEVRALVDLAALGHHAPRLDELLAIPGSLAAAGLAPDGLPTSSSPTPGERNAPRR